MFYNEHLQLSLCFHFFYHYQYYIGLTKNVFSQQRDLAFVVSSGHFKTEFKGNTGLLKVIVLIKENKLHGLLKCM